MIRVISLKDSSEDAANISGSTLPPDAEILPRRGTTGVIFALKTSFIFSMSSHLVGIMGDKYNMPNKWHRDAPNA